MQAVQIAANVTAAIRAGWQNGLPNCFENTTVIGDVFGLVAAMRLSSGVSAIHEAIGV